MSTKQNETLFGQDQNTVITVVSVIIFVLSVAMLATFAYQGTSSGWTGYNVVAVTFSSMIALIFVSIAIYFGFVKSKEALLPGVNELKRLYQSEQDKNKAVKLAADKARSEFLIGKAAEAQRAIDAKNLADKAAKEAVAAQAMAKAPTAPDIKK